ncbi:MAG: hypothetical protein QHC65_04200 [Sphingomonas sp.]|nr:hypothetical protein [Sphingomonas sp.]MDX3883600.1 hypothetical protein [Sphingomonas sp.]
MNAIRHLNRLRWRSVRISRSFKALFNTAEGPLRRDAEIALADIRDFAFAEKSTFDCDALVMARREGRRDVWLRIIRYLNLDEAQVQQLMEIDDGLE